MIGKLMCKLGLFHGPNWCGDRPTYRSGWLEPFARKCGCCGAVWYGNEVETRQFRTVGNWEQQK